METGIAAALAAHHRFVRRTLAVLGVPHVDVEDVAQEVATGIARGWPAFEAAEDRSREDALRSWVYRICEVQVASYTRARSRRGRLEVEEGASLDEAIDGCPDPEERFARGEAEVLLRELLDVLPAERRAVFEAYELEGIAMREIAAALGILLNTAWNRYRLARQALRAEWRRRERARTATEHRCCCSGSPSYTRSRSFTGRSK